MKILVRTRFNVKVHLEESLIKAQTKVTTNGGDWYEIELKNGRILQLGQEVPGFESTLKDLREKSKPLSSTVTSKKSYLEKIEAPSLGSDSMVAPGKSAKKLQEDLSSDKYQGEMIWAHKTAPEILIVGKDKIVKDVDINTMYRRR